MIKDLAIAKTDFVKTKESERIMKASHKAVDKNAWILVLGEVGMGKSTIQRQLVNFWKEHNDRFAVMEFNGFKIKTSRINVMMKKMIRQVKPGEHVPGDIETRYEVFRAAMANAVQKKIKPIIVIDNAQDLSNDTLLELKKIHEVSALGLEHLFTIVMFGKYEMRFEENFKSRELRHRVQRFYLEKPSDAEIFEIARQTFGLTFEKGENKQLVEKIFLRKSEGTPSGVKHIYNKLNFQNDFDGVISLNRLRNSFEVSYVDELKKAGLTVNHVMKAYRDRFKKDIDKSTLSRALNYERDDRTSQNVRDVYNELMGTNEVGNG